MTGGCAMTVMDGFRLGLGVWLVAGAMGLGAVVLGAFLMVLVRIFKQP